MRIYSPQSSKHSKESKFIKPALIAAAIAMTASFLAVIPVTASQAPTPVCAEGICTLTVPYSGSYLIWQPPQGIEFLNFEIYGAQGGKSGGLGAKLAGQLVGIPSELYLFVGGAGARGANLPGGFNGGDQGVMHGCSPAVRYPPARLAALAASGKRNQSARQGRKRDCAPAAARAKRETRRGRTPGGACEN